MKFYSLFQTKPYGLTKSDVAPVQTMLKFRRILFYGVGRLSFSLIYFDIYIRYLHWLRDELYLFVSYSSDSINKPIFPKVLRLQIRAKQISSPQNNESRNDDTYGHCTFSILTSILSSLLAASNWTLEVIFWKYKGKISSKFSNSVNEWSR